MHPNIVLLTNYVKIPSQSRVLCAGLEDANYITEVAQKAAEVQVLHGDGRVIASLKSQLGQYENIQVSDTVFPELVAYFDLVLVGIPKGRDVTRALLTTCLQALKENGTGFVVGANKGGVKTALTDMQTLTRALSLGTKQRHRIFSMVRTADTKLPVEWLDFAKPQTLTIEFEGYEYTVQTQPGLFSYAHLDGGTHLLLEALSQLEIPSQQRFLDAGCGYGIVGKVIERKFDSAQVVWVDVDLLALNCVRTNQPAKRVLYADLTQDSLPDDAPFDWIICNPPFHQQHAVDTSFMQSFAENAKRLLTRKGRLVLVYNAFLPYEKLLGVHFSSITILAENNLFKVILAQR